MSEQLGEGVELLVASVEYLTLHRKSAYWALLRNIHEREAGVVVVVVGG